MEVDVIVKTLETASMCFKKELLDETPSDDEMTLCAKENEFCSCGVGETIAYGSLTRQNLL